MSKTFVSLLSGHASYKGSETDIVISYSNIREITCTNTKVIRSQRPRGLRCRSAAVRLLGL
jgi:hypothetical protein